MHVGARLIAVLHPLFDENSVARHDAQMAESVDALVSNTSGATRAGSTPALGTRVLKKANPCLMEQGFFIIGWRKDNLTEPSSLAWFREG